MKMYSLAKIRILAATGLIILIAHFQAFSQTYQVNGTAVDNGNGLVRLTTAQATVAQRASAWNTTKIDLTQTFDMSFDMFFGCNKDVSTGGDGMTFTFHNDARGLNALGEGFGFLGIGGNGALSPAISIEFDTYDASAVLGVANEMEDDHIAVDINGDVNQTTSGPNTFAGTNGMVTHQAIAGGRDLEDCSGVNSSNYYSIRVVWTYVNDTTQTLQLYEEGALTMTYTGNLINTVFGGNALVYWGFTGSTGTASNEQWIAPKEAIIPWQCASGNTCCLPYIVTPTSPTTICNTPITLRVEDHIKYTSFNWSDGSTDSTLQISVPGTYTLNVLQDQLGNSCPGSATFTITPTGPTATLTGGDTFCDTTQTTDLSIALTGVAPWSFVYAKDGVNQPPITTSDPSYLLPVNAPHTYELVSVSDNSGCNSSATGSATVDLFPGIPVGYDTIFTAPNTANLYVKDDGGTYNWYDAPTGGNLVQAGDTSFTTPVLNETTTYYVENTAVTSTTPEVVGLPGPGTGSPGTNPDDVWMNFKANTDFHFDGITCAVNIPGTPFIDTRLVVTIQDLTDPGIVHPPTEILYTAADGLPQGGITPIYVPLNYSIINGHDYRISYRGRLVSDPNQQGSLQGLIFWNYASGVNAYPINKDPEVTLTRVAPQTEAYPGLFNWEISVPSASSSCGRTAVTAYTCPKGVLSGNAEICNDGSTTPLTVVLTGRTPYTLTYAIDGLPQPEITGITTSPYIFQSLTGAHNYTLISVSNGDCDGTVSGSAVVTLTDGAPIGHDDNFTAPGTADLYVDDEGDIYEWYDAATGGNLLYTGHDYTTPILNATTTYYVNNSSIVNVSQEVVGLPGPGTGSPGTNPDDVWMNFKANTDFHFDGITCAVNIPGTPFSDTRLVVTIQDLTNPGIVHPPTEILYTAADGLPQGGITPIYVPLNYSIINGHDYRISYRGRLVSDPNQQGSLQGLIFWNYASGVNAYPINKDPEVTLTRVAPQTEAYPGLFNWEISVISSTPTCGRTPVTAYVCPTAVLSGDAVICDDGTTTTELSVALTGDAPWALTYAIDGVAQPTITGITTPNPYTITSATGAHVYTLVSVSNATSTGCANGASGTATVTVNPDAPVANNVTFLPGDAANLTVDNPVGTYNWFTSASGGTAVHTGSTYSPVLTNTTTLYVQHVDANGDTSCTRTPVTAYLCPTAVLSGDAVICNDGTTTTQLSVALTGASPWTLTYAIDGVSQTAITGISAPNPYLITSATGAHVYTLVAVTNATSTGCANGTSGTATVTVNPDAPVGHDATFVSPGAAILTVDNNAGSTFNWYDAATGGNLVNTGITYTTPTLTANTTYYVEQVIGGIASCERTPVTAIVFVPTAALFIPNLMTPNSDGKNDRFEILGLPDGSKLGVYNRWGNAVYQSDNYNNQWTAENISAGVYYYDLKLKNGESYKGWLQIIY